ncbi:TolB family protein [Spongiimicrobium sp. 2-473A-2-J]|uniref:TolB family protein n=1 Tax=Eudoraea algarum TaxID=3417568 RepID=UPI003D366425
MGIKCILLALLMGPCLVQGQAKQRLIFNSDVSSRDSELYSINADGTGLRQLTFDAVSRRGNDGGQVSPDGKYITFATYKYGGWKVALAKSDFTGQKKWTKGPQYTWGAAWAPNSKSLVYNKVATKSPPYFDGDAEIFRMNLDGSGDTNLTRTKGLDHSPTWSPDGKKIVFFSDRDGSLDIFTMDPDGRNQVNLTNTPDIDEFAPCWSPDSKRIAYHHMPKGKGKRYIDTYSMDADGKNRVNLTGNQSAKRNLYTPYYPGALPIYGYQTAWSPDGGEIAYASRRTGNFELFLVRADGRGIRQLTTNGGINMYPHWVD